MPRFDERSANIALQEAAQRPRVSLVVSRPSPVLDVALAVTLGAAWAVLLVWWLSK